MKEYVLWALSLIRQRTHGMYANGRQKQAVGLLPLTVGVTLEHLMATRPETLQELCQCTQHLQAKRVYMLNIRASMLS